MNADENLFRERKFQENIILYLFIEAKFEWDANQCRHK